MEKKEHCVNTAAGALISVGARVRGLARDFIVERAEHAIANPCDGCLVSPEILTKFLCEDAYGVHISLAEFVTKISISIDALDFALSGLLNKADDASITGNQFAWPKLLHRLLQSMYCLYVIQDGCRCTFTLSLNYGSSCAPGRVVNALRVVLEGMMPGLSEPVLATIKSIKPEARD